MEPSTVEPSKETLWQWHFGLILPCIISLYGCISLPLGVMPSDRRNIFDVPIDHDPHVPNMVETIPHYIVWPLL
jgi:hypothetical protein